MDRLPVALIGHNSTLRQYFEANEDFLSGISIKFGTYCSVIHHGLTLQIAALDGETIQPFHTTFSNGAYLNDAMIERIMASPINALNISIDAATDETYRRIRIGGPHIDQIFRSAKGLVDARSKHNRTRNLSISLSFTLMYANIHELLVFVRKAAESGVDAVLCRHVEIHHPEMEQESLFFHKEYYNSVRDASIYLANNLGIDLSLGGPLKDSGPRALEPCPIPWSTAALLANGDVMACCVPGSKMGSVNEESIEEIWQGRNYQKLRARVNSIDPPSLCKNCQYRRSTMSSGTLNNYDSAASLRGGLSAKPLLEEFRKT